MVRTEFSMNIKANNREGESQQHGQRVLPFFPFFISEKAIKYKEKGKDRESKSQEGRQEGESVLIEVDSVHVELP